MELTSGLRPLIADDSLLQLTRSGLYCPAGDFYIDPWESVPRAVITHAHADHARPGCGQYLTTPAGRGVLQERMGGHAKLELLEYGQSISQGGVRLSLHPAGHLLGSAQVRLERRSEVCVVSGDYKIDPDPTCAAFEPVQCHTFVTESTFGLPVFRWPKQQEVFEQINAWWRANREAGRASLLFAYALGKAQRLLAGIDPSIGPIYTHGAVDVCNRSYREAGVELPDAPRATSVQPKELREALTIAPPLSKGTPWMRRFGDASTAFASGWMAVRGARRRRAVDRGFVLSDHADWPGLLEAIQATQAERVLVTHGYIGAMVRWLREQGVNADGLQTRYEGEQDEVEADSPVDQAGPEAET